MKMKSSTLFVAGALALATFGVTALAQTPPSPEPPPSTTPPPAGVPPTTGHHEHHSTIRAAIHALEKAKAELEHADHDFGGHRADALAECDKAIEQLHLALQFDKK